MCVSDLIHFEHTMRYSSCNSYTPVEGTTLTAPIGSEDFECNQVSHIHNSVFLGMYGFQMEKHEVIAFKYAEEFLTWCEAKCYDISLFGWW